MTGRGQPGRFSAKSAELGSANLHVDATTGSISKHEADGIARMAHSVTQSYESAEATAEDHRAIYSERVTEILEIISPRRQVPVPWTTEFTPAMASSSS